MLSMRIINDIDELNDVDFDGLVGHTWNQLKTNYPFPKKLKRVSDKKAFIRQIVELEMPHDYSLVIVVSDDEKDIMLLLARITGNTIIYNLCLLQPNRAGTRSWLYSDEYKDLMRKMRDDLGITNIVTKTFQDGTAKNYLKKRFVDTDVSIDKEKGYRVEKFTSD